MAFKDCCCGLCAWFSVIGALCFLMMFTMLSRGNLPVTEHKFGLPGDKTTEISAAKTQMIVMTFVMIGAALLCFVSSFIFAR